MIKKRLVNTCIQLASNKLGLEDIIVEFRSNDYFISSEVSAIFKQKSYTIIFNIDWIKSANELEILKCTFHETRHAYQRSCIDFPDYMTIDVDSETLKIRKEEFSNYNSPDNLEDYLNQSIELDAIKFSEDFLNEILNDL